MISFSLLALKVGFETGVVCCWGLGWDVKKSLNAVHAKGYQNSSRAYNIESGRLSIMISSGETCCAIHCLYIYRMLEGAFHRFNGPNARRPISHFPFSWHSSYLFPALLAFPGRCFAPPFIFLLEKPVKSPLDIASPLFLNLFLPPKPNLSSFFWRLFGPRRSFLLGLAVSSSSATSKISASLVVCVSAPWRSFHYCQ